MQSLYRKYRPQTFQDVIGQDHVVETLSGAVANKKVGHAYLFSGGRGIGKTSIARIFAKELSVSDDDLYEIDAASHTGVDDIRELREGAATLPINSPYKVYLLDEVHMLSKGAFNALLKILEEPPAHVIFMLATTDVHKVPDTVLSRCEVYTLNRPTRTVLADVVKRIAKQEKYKIDPGATDLLALIGDGSFRDTLSLLQQTMTSVSDAHITDEAVQRITGAPAHTTVRTIIDAWVAGDAATALRTLVEAHERGSQMQVLYARLLDTVRAVLLVRFAPDMKETLQKLFSPEDMAYIAGLSDPAGPGKRINSKMLKTILDVGWGINRSEVPHIILEALSLELSGVGESPNQSS